MHPIIAPQDLSMLANLLELLSDPAKAKQAVQELQEANSTLTKAQEQGTKDLQEAQRLQVEIDKKRALLEEAQTAFAAEKYKWDAERTATSNEIAKIQSNLNHRNVELDDRQQTIAARLADLSEREKDLTERERMVAGYIADYKKLNKELEDRLARIKEAAA